ncbi:MAG: sigma-70 family RNA polymerase sigma factor [Phycisphaerales bacterium]
MALTARDVTTLVDMTRAGDSSAGRRLMEAVYDELRGLAGAYLARQSPGHTLQPTALVHEAFIKLMDQTGAAWNGRAHFFAVAAKAMRHILVDHARARKADKRGGDWQRVTLDGAMVWSGDKAVDTLSVHEALEELAALDERQAQVVEMRYFGGLTVDEVAVVLDVSKSTVEADWRMARAWLSKKLAERESA